jgi:primosomal protein N' (replication factor Y)
MSFAPQKTLFDDEPVPWEEDDAAEHLIATVVFPQGPPQEYDYRVPDKLRSQVEAGRRVRVPLGHGNRLELGYCVRLENKRLTARRLKDVRSVVDDTRLLSPAMLRLTHWIADRYLCPLGQVLETVLPTGVRQQAGTRLATLLALSPAARRERSGLKLTAKQAQIVDYLAGCTQPVTSRQIMQAVHCTEGPIKSLREKGILQAEVRRLMHATAAEAAPPQESHLQLNPDQQAALDATLAALADGRHETFLLHGITGSGKTEVYIQTIQEVLRFGRQAIVLVPEISLTPQTKERFRARFGEVAVLHSHLTDAERHWQWQRIARGEVQLVVGARSAVFAPTPHLGLIVLDEEHEASFKQDKAPRYHARDVALERARAEKIPLLLGSATPSLESWHRAQSGEYRLLALPRRVMNLSLPDVRMIDLRNEVRNRMARGALSRGLRLAMQETLADGGQVILLLNRRGFSTHIQCPACGQVVRCPRCDIALTHHHQAEIALCHYCDFEVPAPTRCPQCEFPGIRFSGFGTQRLEAEVRANFPDHACLRMDTDTMQRPGSHERALAAFRSGDVRILLGTQMIAKGLDFPNVTLVGVVNADTALHLPDFRAAERTFQLLVQVAGRSGRGERGGQVLVQTFSPDHPALVFASRHDYEGFARSELPMREALSYPPYASMIRLVVRGPKQHITAEFADHMAGLLGAGLERLNAQARVLGPAPAPLARLKDYYRFQVQLQGADGELLRTAAREVSQGLKPPEDVQWQFDVDPLDML